jgi:hypothetical protein
VLEFYRLRWQIELVFKRMKSILGLGHLPKKDPLSAQAWLEGKLFTGLLIERMIDTEAEPPRRSSPARGGRTRQGSRVETLFFRPAGSPAKQRAFWTLGWRPELKSFGPPGLFLAYLIRSEVLFLQTSQSRKRRFCVAHARQDSGFSIQASQGR